MSDLRREDAQARAAALDTSRSFIVQAPAGSGKTELLTQRFLALLTAVERPESVLAITFTRKAAAEMRSRILQALRDIGDPEREARMLPETVTLARSVLAADRTRGWGLLANPNRLRLLTIDALNQGLARRLPVLSGTGAGLGVEEDARPLYELAAERLLAHLPGDDAHLGDAVALLLDHLDNNVGKFVALVAEMLARREAWLPELPGDLRDPGTETSTRAALESARRVLVGAQLDALAATFPMPLLAEACRIARTAARHLHDDGVESPLAAWRDCDRIPSADPGDVPLWQGLAFLLLTSEGGVRQKPNRRQGIPADQKALKADLAAVLDSLAPLTATVETLATLPALPGPAYDDAEWRVLRALFLVLRVASGELQLVFTERKLADYPYFASAARQALGTDDEPTDTALALDATLRHVLVDEFQDTSEAQVDLLDRLTAGWEPGDGRTVFLVGDPMQSIYRFRHAEVGLFLNVRDQGIGIERGSSRIVLEPLTLRVNFRSTRPVVDWVNRCFTEVLPARDDDLRGAVRYSDSVAKESAGEEGGVVVHAFLRKSRQREAQCVADIAQRRLAESETARVAVLVQSRGHLVAIVAELARRGLEFQATDIDPLGERTGVLDALALTCAIAHLADRSSWLAVLRAPWCGLTLAELLDLVGDAQDANVRDLLREESRLARLAAPARERVARASQAIETARTEARRFGLRTAVERAWLALDGPATLGTERELEEVEAYFDELSEVEARSDGAVDFASLAEALDQLYAPSRPRPGIRIELMTIHKSKGLRFDTVIVPAPSAAAAPTTSDCCSGRRCRNVSARTSWSRHSRRPATSRTRYAHGCRRSRRTAASRSGACSTWRRPGRERWLHLLGTATVLADRDTGETEEARPWHEPRDPRPVLEHHFVERLAEAGGFEGEEPTGAARSAAVAPAGSLARAAAAARTPDRDDGPATAARRRRRAVRLGRRDGASRRHGRARRAAASGPRRVRAVRTRADAAGALCDSARGTRRPRGSARRRVGAGPAGIAQRDERSPRALVARSEARTVRERAGADGTDRRGVVEDRHRPHVRRCRRHALDRRLQDRCARGRRARGLPRPGTGALPAPARTVCRVHASARARAHPPRTVFPVARRLARVELKGDIPLFRRGPKKRNVPN